MRPCFAGLNALVPCVVKFCGTSTSAASEPRTSTTTATDFARFLHASAFGAYGTNGHRRTCWHLYGSVGERSKEINSITVTTRMGMHAIRLVLTFAGLDSLKPPVADVSVAGTSAVVKPSTPRSAATDSTGLLKLAAL